MHEEIHVVDVALAVNKVYAGKMLLRPQCRQVFGVYAY